MTEHNTNNIESSGLAPAPRRIRRKTERTVWEVWVYDVFGNKRDGYEVNDRSCITRIHEIRCIVDYVNANTGAPATSGPTDKQIRDALGLKRVRIDTDGDDTHIYVTHGPTGYPIGELICTSHRSLSPIDPTFNTLIGRSR